MCVINTFLKLTKSTFIMYSLFIKENFRFSECEDLAYLINENFDQT